MRLHTILAFLFFIALSLLAGMVGSLFTIDQVPTWYATIVKPAWTPPAYVFGPVWTLLYVLMGSAAALVWTSGKPGRFLAIWLFVAHLVVNALWSIVFFGLHELSLALIIIGLLWGVIIALMRVFAIYSRTAAWLLVPYLAWVTYAASLNLGILFLN